MEVTLTSAGQDGNEAISNPNHNPNPNPNPETLQNYYQHHCHTFD